MDDTNNQESKRIERLPLAKLYERGWTRATIKKFLGAPDKIDSNPRFENAAPMKLFDLTRIEAVEATIEFHQWKIKSIKRVEASNRAVDTRVRNFIEKMQKVKVEIPLLEKEELIKKACEHFNNFLKSRFDVVEGCLAYNYDSLEEYDLTYASPSSNEQFLHRISVNYLRHVKSKYHDHLYGFYGKAGQEEAYLELFKNHLNKIAEVYPWLEEECRKQLENKLQDN